MNGSILSTHSDDSKSEDEGGIEVVNHSKGYDGYDDSSYIGNKASNLFNNIVYDDAFKDDHNGMHGFLSGNEFTVTEHCSFYMDRVVITSNNHQAVKSVYI